MILRAMAGDGIVIQCVDFPSSSRVLKVASRERLCPTMQRRRKSHEAHPCRCSTRTPSHRAENLIAKSNQSEMSRASRENMLHPSMGHVRRSCSSVHPGTSRPAERRRRSQPWRQLCGQVLYTNQSVSLTFSPPCPWSTRLKADRSRQASRGRRTKIVYEDAMALHIRANRAATLARRLAKRKGITMTDAVIEALEGALAREGAAATRAHRRDSQRVRSARRPRPRPRRQQGGNRQALG